MRLSSIALLGVAVLVAGSPAPRVAIDGLARRDWDRGVHENKQDGDGGDGSDRGGHGSGSWPGGSDWNQDGSDRGDEDGDDWDDEDDVCTTEIVKPTTTECDEEPTKTWWHQTTSTDCDERPTTSREHETTSTCEEETTHSPSTHRSTTTVTTTICTESSSAIPTPTTSTSCTETSHTSSTPTSTTSSTPMTSSTPTTSPPATTTPPPTTCTPVSWTNTNTYTTVSSCPTPYEIGTYCGFINPEDPCAVQPDGKPFQTPFPTHHHTSVHTVAPWLPADTDFVSLGYGPHVTPDTPAAFESYPEFAADALNAVTPTGYTESFANLNAAVFGTDYYGMDTLHSYNVSACAAACDANTSCGGFNIFIERDPSINPGQCSCTNPPSITNYKCQYWGSGVDTADANNYGQYRVDFQVVIAGSNGYVKS